MVFVHNCYIRRHLHASLTKRNCLCSSIKCEEFYSKFPVDFNMQMRRRGAAMTKCLPSLCYTNCSWCRNKSVYQSMLVKQAHCSTSGSRTRRSPDKWFWCEAFAMSRLKSQVKDAMHADGERVHIGNTIAIQSIIVWQMKDERYIWSHSRFG